MADIDEQKDLIGYCGAYCGECGMYKGRIYAKVAKDFLEILRASRKNTRTSWVETYRDSMQRKSTEK